MFENNRFVNNIPPAVKNIIIINVIMYIATFLIGDVMYEKFALFHYKSPFFKMHQLVTYMFMHGGLAHIFFNMFTLFSFGVTLERVWGTQRFLVYYFVTGIGAALLQMGVNSFQMQDVFLLSTPTVGASGSIYGLLMAFGLMFPNNIIYLLFPPIPLKAKYFVLIFGALELLLGLKGGGNIAHFAHLGGMLFGFVLMRIWRRSNNW